MQVATVPDLLRFYCPHCRAELTVPKALAGVQGPCPSCQQTIQAPVVPVAPAPPRRVSQPAVPSRTATASREVTVTPLAERAGIATPPSSRATRTTGRFQPRKAIPPSEEPLDETWRDKAQQQARKASRARRAERAAQRFLDSRLFRVGRLAALIAIGGVSAWVYVQIQQNNWTFGRMDQQQVAQPQPMDPGPVMNPGDEPDILPISAPVNNTPLSGQPALASPMNR